MLKRTTIFLHDGQMKTLGAIAKAHGSASTAEYVRLAIHQFIARETRKQAVPAAHKRKEAIGE